MLSVTKCDIKKIGVIFYQLFLIRCDILNVHLLQWDIIQAQNAKV
jgi:hypothetical protein